MNELKPEDVMRAWEWNEHCAEIMGSYTASYTEIHAILALLRKKDAEIERLRASCTELAQCCTKLETLYKIECKRVDTVKANNVSEIKTRFAMRFGTYTGRDMTPITEVFRLLDQIAKEMVEES